MLAVLGILVLLVLPSVIGIVHDRRIDRQIRQAQQAHRAAEGSRPKTERPKARQGYLTTTVTPHS
jgi:type II secretory pathway pseudopilin PulG